MFHNEGKNLHITLNEENHVSICGCSENGNILDVFERAYRAVAGLSKVGDFAHDPSLGYLTSCPTNLGTALRISITIDLCELS